MRGLAPRPKCVSDSKWTRKQWPPEVPYPQDRFVEGWECQRTQQARKTSWKKPGCQRMKARGCWTNLGGLGEAIGLGCLALGQVAGGQGYLWPCLLVYGCHRSLGLFFFFFSEVTGAFGRPNPVGKIESNQTQGQWGRKQWMGPQAGRVSTLANRRAQSHLLLEFSVWDARPGCWVHVEPMVQGLP